MIKKIWGLLVWVVGYAFIVGLILFGLVGAVVVATTMHEFSHKADLGNNSINDTEEICVFNLSPNLYNIIFKDYKIGYYKARFVNLTIFEQSIDLSEKKAKRTTKLFL